MKFRQSRNVLFALSVAFMLTSCGPVVEIFNVDVKVPAKYPIEFANKSVAVFSNVGKGKDSLLMVNLASGISASLEKNLSYETGSVPVFVINNDSSAVRDIYYLQSLSQKSNSDILIIIDSLRLGIPEHTKAPLNSNSGDRYDVNYVFVPFTSVVNIYDGITAENMVSIRQTDTVYWEVLSRSDMKANIMAKIYNSLDNVSQGVGKSVTENLFDKWETVGRYLYIFNDARWVNAFDLAKNFKWSEASALWMQETASTDKLRAACAAFNMAVACEMNSKKDLALKWIEYSQSCYNLTGVENYKLLLKK